MSDNSSFLLPLSNSVSLFCCGPCRFWTHILKRIVSQTTTKMMKKQVSFSSPPRHASTKSMQHHATSPSAPRYPDPQPLHRRSRTLSLRSRRPPKGSFPSPLDHQPAPPVGAFPISLLSKDKKPSKDKMSLISRRIGASSAPSLSSPSHSTRTAQYNKHGPSKMKKSIKRVVSPLNNNGRSTSLSPTKNNNSSSNNNDSTTTKKSAFLFPSETYNNDNKYYVSSTPDDSSYFTTRSGTSGSLSLRDRVSKSMNLVLGRRNRKGVGGNSTVHPNPTPTSTNSVIRSGTTAGTRGCGGGGTIASTIGITHSSSTLEEDELPLMLEFKIDTTLTQQDHQFYDEFRGVFNGKSLDEQDDGNFININKENNVNLKEQEVEVFDDDQSDSRQSTTGTTISGVNSASPPSRILRFEI